ISEESLANPGDPTPQNYIWFSTITGSGNPGYDHRPGYSIRNQDNNDSNAPDRIIRTCEDMIAPIVQTVGLYAQWAANFTLDPSDESPDDPDAATGDTTSCAIAGIGWFLCPILSFFGLIVDGAFAMIEGMLVVQPIIATGN